MVEEKRNINIYFFINFYYDEDINTSFIGSIRLAIWNSSVYGYWQFVDDRMSNV